MYAHIVPDLFRSKHRCFSFDTCLTWFFFVFFLGVFVVVVVSSAIFSSELEHLARRPRAVQARPRGRDVGAPGEREERPRHVPGDGDPSQEDHRQLRRLRGGEEQAVPSQRATHSRFVNTE